MDEIKIENIFEYTDDDGETLSISSGNCYGEDLMVAGSADNTCYITCLLTKKNAIRLAESIIKLYS